MSAGRDFVPLEAALVAEHMHALCAIGNRYVGTPGEAAARDYVLRQLRAGGLADVRAEELSVRTYQCAGAACEVPDWQLEPSCAGFPATASGEVEAQAVFLGRGQSIAELLAHESRLPPLAGRIAVFQSHWPWEVSDALLERGVAALVLISEAPDDAIGHLPARSYGSLVAADGHAPLPVPGVIVGAATGAQLTAALVNGTGMLRLRHEAVYRHATTANLIGELRGDDDQTVVVAAHYDTYPAGVGAHDNASGLAGLLAMLATWRGRRPRRTLRFASFAAEELGLCGAREYCRAHVDSLADVLAMINLDALAWRLPSPRCLVVDSALEPLAHETLAAADWDPEIVWDARSASSDTRPFTDAGVPTAWCWRFPPQHPYFGGDGDSLAMVDIDLVTDVANAAAYLVHRLATDGNLAVGRSTPPVA